MNRTNQVNKFRILWEQIMVGNKLEVCTEELNEMGILDVNILRLLFNNSEIQIAP